MQPGVNPSRPVRQDWSGAGAGPASSRSLSRWEGLSAGRPAERSWLRWCERRANALSKLGFAATLVCYGLVASYGLSLSGQWDETRRSAVAALNDVTLAAGLGIEKVVVEGRVNLSETDIADALGATQGVSIFAFDTGAARDRLKQHGWVREARVMRLLPSSLVVELEERQPYAIWREGGSSVAIDAGGRVLDEAQASAFPTLPVVSGPGAAAPAREMVEALRSFPELAARLREAERIAGRRWDLLLDTGMRAKLPAGQIRTTLADLNAMIAKNPAALYELAELDFRVGSQFTLRLKDASTEGRKRFMSWFAKARGGRESTL